jgi:multidrug resistance efflux pump
MRGKHLAVAAILFVAATATGTIYYFRIRQSPPRPDAPGKSTVTYQPGSEADLMGTIHARNVVLVAAPMDGVMDYVAVTIGESVTEGQLLAQLRNDALTAELKNNESDLARAQERLSTLESQLSAGRLEESRAAADASRAREQQAGAERASERQQMLLREGAGTRNAADRAREELLAAQQEYAALRQLADTARQRVQDLRRQVDTARTQLQETEKDLDVTRQGMEGTEVFAPVAGVLEASRFQQGDRVSVEVPDLFTIASDLNSLEVTATVAKEMAPHIQPGQNVVVFPGDAPQPVPGVIREIRDGSVIVDFQNSSPAIKPGQKAQLRFKLK